MEFKISTPAGCPGGGLGYHSSTILIIIFLVFAAYFGLGTFYNIKTQNLSGKEAIPNIDFWRTFPELVQEGMTKSVQSAKEAGQWVKGKISGDKSGYNEF
jgi:hypothetical protein